MICACAVDERGNFTTSHFGDSEAFDLYGVEKGRIEYLTRIVNLSEGEGPVKAAMITASLKQAQVGMLLSRRFGQNIRRVRRHFIPVLVREEGLSPQEALTRLLKQEAELEREPEAGEYPVLYLES